VGKTRREFLSGFVKALAAAALVPAAQISARSKPELMPPVLGDPQPEFVDAVRKLAKEEQYRVLYGGTVTGRLKSNEPFWQEVSRGNHDRVRGASHVPQFKSGFYAHGSKCNEYPEYTNCYPQVLNSNIGGDWTWVYDPDDPRWKEIRGVDIRLLPDAPDPSDQIEIDFS
jgi:hypothetical protein